MKRIAYLCIVIPLSLLTVLMGTYLFSRSEPAFLLKNIKVQGNMQLSESDVLRKVHPFLKNSIFSTDMSKVRESIATHPYVREVRVKRIFPFSILIDVKEKTPSALWIRPGGTISILDEEGESYRGLMKEKTDRMFVINGGEKRDAKSLFKEINHWMEQGIIQKEFLSEVVYSEGNVTLFSLDDGVEIILGKEDQKERLRRAVAILEDAKKRGVLIRCVDARFDRGAIIKERKG
jgi:cell division protein FtsQ